MRTNGLKQRLRAGEAVIGSVLTTPEPFFAEVMGAAGFDFVLIDTEHSPFSLTELQTVLIALAAGGSPVVVRAPWNDPVAVKQILDLGADGVILPWVNNRQECAAAVAAARYPPEGVRGCGPRRAARLGPGGVAEYFRRANEEVLALVQIEQAAAVERLEEILTTPGLDGVMVGPADLAASMGYLQDLENPAVEETIQRILEGCRRHGVPFGMFTATAARARKWIQRGGQMATIGGDLWFLDAGIAAAKGEARAILGRPLS
jgi:2-keto-3-deoxy-L-rhamnonate aldolase RhmA